MTNRFRPSLLAVVALAVIAPAGAAERWGPPRDGEFRSELDGSVQRYVELLPEPFDPAQETHLLIGLHGHGAGPLIGRWDAQEGVPGRGDHRVLASMWFSSELQVTTPVPEWGGKRVRMAQEEDFGVGADGTPRWFKGRQDRLWVVR